MIFQRTLKRSVTITGIGLHSGKTVKLVLKPARAGRGIVFVRTDLEGAPEIAANYKSVINTQMATTIGHGTISVSTVEHVLAALQGLGVDNAVIEVDGPEVPILDGSAAPVAEAILEVGLESQLKPRTYVALRRRVEVRMDDKVAIAEPASRLEIHASIFFKHPMIGEQEYRYVHGEKSFADIAGARTFGFLRDVEALKRIGLARGGSLNNAVVLDDELVMNPEGLRYSDEFVRHKVLDALGDLKLAGTPILGYIRLHRAGHEIHSQLVAEIFRNPDNYEVIGGSSFSEDRRLVRSRVAVARTRLAATY